MATLRDWLVTCQARVPVVWLEEVRQVTPGVKQLDEGYREIRGQHASSDY